MKKTTGTLGVSLKLKSSDSISAVRRQKLRAGASGILLSCL